MGTMSRKVRAATGILLPLAIAIATVSITAAMTIVPSSDRSIKQVKLATPPTVRYILKELLNSPGKSKDAALFEIDGVTRPIRVAESIGASGWILVEVNNRQALIRRNGEVRSIDIGQEF
jgi:hypothetical protein